MSLKLSNVPTSANERDFVLRALGSGCRCDGRAMLESRRLRMRFERSEQRAAVELELGRTRVLVVVTADIVPPYPDRPTDGFIQFAVELSPMANPAFQAGRPSAQAVELNRSLERIVRDSRGVDTEALCIVSGSKVWSLKCTAHALDDDGNLVDALTVALVGALRHFRLPVVTVAGESVTVHSIAERAPVPIAMHHAPIGVTFALFPPPAAASPDAANAPRGGASSAAASVVGIVDPTAQEEAVMSGRMTFAFTPHAELVAAHKAGGEPVDAALLLRFARTASNVAKRMHTSLDKALQRADEEWSAGRLRMLRGAEFVSAAATGAGGGVARGSALSASSSPVSVPSASQSSPATNANTDADADAAMVEATDAGETEASNNAGGQVDYNALHMAPRLPAAGSAAELKAKADAQAKAKAGAARSNQLLLAMQNVADAMERDLGPCGGTGTSAAAGPDGGGAGSTTSAGASRGRARHASLGVGVSAAVSAGASVADRPEAEPVSAPPPPPANAAVSSASRSEKKAAAAADDDAAMLGSDDLTQALKSKKKKKKKSKK